MPPQFGLHQIVRTVQNPPLWLLLFPFCHKGGVFFILSVFTGLFQLMVAFFINS